MRPALDRAPQQLLMEWQLLYCPGVSGGRPGTLHLKGRLGERDWQETLHRPDFTASVGLTLEDLVLMAPDIHAGASPMGWGS